MFREANHCSEDTLMTVIVQWALRLPWSMEACNTSTIFHSSAHGRLSVPILRKIEMFGECEKAQNRDFREANLGLLLGGWLCPWLPTVCDRLTKIELYLTLCLSHLVWNMLPRNTTGKTTKDSKKVKKAEQRSKHGQAVAWSNEVTSHGTLRITRRELE